VNLTRRRVALLQCILEVRSKADLTRRRVALLQCILEARSKTDSRDELTQLYRNYRKFSEENMHYMQCDGLDTIQYNALIEYLLAEVSKIYNHKLPKKVDQEFGYQRTLEVL
jgi:predicted alpha-1,6-mannanase (GH76 family)